MGREVELAKGFFAFEMRLAALEDMAFVFEMGILLFLKVLVEAFEAAGDLIEVAEYQFEFEIGGVAERVDTAGGVGNGRIVENAQDVGDGVHFAERSKQGGVARAVFLRPLQAADVHVLHCRVGDFSRLVKSGELVEARLGNFGDADVSGRGGGLGVEMGFREDAEEGGFADLWQADDAGLHEFGIVA